MIDLNSDETELLSWLSDGSGGQLEERHHKALDKLVELGLAQTRVASFLTKNFETVEDVVYAISLTEEGKQLAAKLAKYDDIE